MGHRPPHLHSSIIRENAGGTQPDGLLKCRACTRTFSRPSLLSRHYNCSGHGPNQPVEKKIRPRHRYTFRRKRAILLELDALRASGIPFAQQVLSRRTGVRVRWAVYQSGKRREMRYSAMLELVASGICAPTSPAWGDTPMQNSKCIPGFCGAADTYDSARLVNGWWTRCKKFCSKLEISPRRSSAAPTAGCADSAKGGKSRTSVVQTSTSDLSRNGCQLFENSTAG